MSVAKLFEVYKCEVCGNIVEVVHDGAGELVCCGQPMKLLEEKASEQGNEKHLPVVEASTDEIRVKVGEVAHPMEEKHYIEWIEILTSAGTIKKFLKPGDKPEAIFKVSERATAVRSYCNIHGLWKKLFNV